MEIMFLQVTDDVFTSLYRFNNHAIAMEIDQLAVMEYSRYKGMPCIENKDIYI